MKGGGLEDWGFTDMVAVRGGEEGRRGRDGVGKWGNRMVRLTSGDISSDRRRGRSFFSLRDRDCWKRGRRGRGRGERERERRER